MDKMLFWLFSPLRGNTVLSPWLMLTVIWAQQGQIQWDPNLFWWAAFPRGKFLYLYGGWCCGWTWLGHNAQSFGQTPVQMWLWRYILEKINIYISKLWVKHSAFHNVGGPHPISRRLQKKDRGPLRKKELRLQTALELEAARSTLAWISSLLVCPTHFRFASPTTA